MCHLYGHRILCFVVALALLSAPACALAQWSGAASGPPAPIRHLAQDVTRPDARSAARVLVVPYRLGESEQRAVAPSYTRVQSATGLAVQVPMVAAAAAWRPGQVTLPRRGVRRRALSRALKGGVIGALAGAAFASWRIMGACEAGPCFSRPDSRRDLLAWTVGGAAVGAFMGAVTAGDAPTSR
jgi:hypothetical protein